ncbi:MAG TPA: hypothetical protein VLB87_10190, partial [Pyrinomonadaceae bacterium]|nr:hypothetical protein [Pyrinomonadaceae bacterium]
MHLFKPQICALLFVLFFAKSITPAQQSGPPPLSYNDLLALYENDVPPAELAPRLDRLLTTPFINNSVGLRGPKAGARHDFGKRFIRVATWNIERGLEFEAIKAALSNDQRFFRRLSAADRGSRFNIAEILEQAQ